MVTYNEWTGWPSNLELKKCLGQYLRQGHHHHVKVGITNDPVRRFKEHKKVYTWEKMVVFYKTVRYENATEVERLLINHLEESNAEFVHYNKREGGAGKIPESGPYYVYLLASAKYKLRNS